MSKLVSVTVSLTTARVREGLRILFSTTAYSRVNAIAAGLTLPRKGIRSWKSISGIPSSRKFKSIREVGDFKPRWFALGL